MKKAYILIIFLVFLGFLLFFTKNESIQPEPEVVKYEALEVMLEDKGIAELPVQLVQNVAQPLSNGKGRKIVKPFGIYITSQNSPVQPERFTGYHTGVDFEVFDEEIDQAVVVVAMCSGLVKVKQYGSGYGGMLVQACELDQRSVTVVYGHLDLASIEVEVGDFFEVGQRIGLLGADKSSATDFERKHLHLGIYKGASVNTRGYVGSEAELTQWLDPCLYVCESKRYNS